MNWPFVVVTFSLAAAARNNNKRKKKKKKKDFCFFFVFFLKGRRRGSLHKSFFSFIRRLVFFVYFLKFKFGHLQ